MTLIIAEAGVNHNGSLDRAVALVEAAATAGANVVKFQTFRADKIATRQAPKADYQTRTTGSSTSQYDMLKALELDHRAHAVIHDACVARGVEFMSSPFDEDSATFLAEEIGVRRLKLGSGELTNAPLLLHVALLGLPLILSTGMSTLADVEAALGALAFGYVGDGRRPSVAAFSEAYASSAGQAALRSKVTLLHCTTEYPAMPETVNMRVMDTVAAAFGLPVGLSDHTEGIAVPIAAVARGATVIEKHFTLDRSLPGPDHMASLEPAELSSMVNGIRQVEKALGSTVKLPAPAEVRNRVVARKSLVASQPVRAGELFTEENLTVKRPGSGLSPFHYWEMLGQPAKRDFATGDMVES